MADSTGNFTEAKTLKDNKVLPNSTGRPLPRFVSLRATVVNLRTGPGVRYPVDWVYESKYLPIEVIAEFENWRKVRDVQGTQGWIHQSMLSSRRTFIIISNMQTLRKKGQTKSLAVAKLATPARDLTVFTSAKPRLQSPAAIDLPSALLKYISAKRIIGKSLSISFC